MSTLDLTRLQAQIWSGSLALEIRLAASDCRTYDTSAPYQIQYPRLSYLASLLPRLSAFFAPALIRPDVGAHEAWVSVEGEEAVPLKWHYPLGLLYDLFSGAGPVDVEDGGKKTGDDGAWRLTVHYSDFPADQLIPLDGEGRAVRDAFTNAVKEADFVRNGSARTVMGLSLIHI